MEAPDPLATRIITTLGHVDHGKTTLMDSLLAANNIISSKMAGQLRYLDSREDEQERGITMESSAVSLKFQVTERIEEGEKCQKTYHIHMIDTPGHVDFSSEVSTASRICDGAILLVDVVEGVCTQTISVLRQAWQDGLKLILVINKIDRLVTELNMSPVDAHNHLSHLVEQVNAIIGSFFAGERMDDDMRWREERERRLARNKNDDSQQIEVMAEEIGEFQERDDKDLYFAPERGNVVFASAIDGWGFRVSKFAHLYASKLGIKETNLRKVLWGHYFLDPKTKKVIGLKHLHGRSLKTFFVKFILENIWAIYEAVEINPDQEKILKIVSSLNLNITSRELESKGKKNLLWLILSRWLSLSTCIAQTIIDIVPAPPVAQASRLPKMLNIETCDTHTEPRSKLEEDLFASKCDDNSCVVAYVSKMFAYPVKELSSLKIKSTIPERKIAGASSLAHDSQPDGESSTVVEKGSDVLLGFARLFSGILRKGSSVFAVLPKYQSGLDPSCSESMDHIVATKIENLYIMMGREMIPVDVVRAGNIFAVEGLEGKVWRNATLCAPGEKGIEPSAEIDQAYLVNLGGVKRPAPPVVRVALEPMRPADMPKLLRGLKLLSQSDPCVEIFQQETGEHVILTAGELHLERCLKDLRERFARVDIQASQPIVPFRETAIQSPELSPTKSSDGVRGRMHGYVLNGAIQFTIRVSPLPHTVLDFILQNRAILKRFQSGSTTGHTQEGPEVAERGPENVDIQGEIVRTPTIKIDDFWTAWDRVCNGEGAEWTGVSNKIWAFGPQKTGACLLVDAREISSPLSFRRSLVHECNASVGGVLDDLVNQIEAGFQLATFQGPLCGEPVQGMAYFFEKMDIDHEALSKEIGQNRMAPVTGSLISAVRDVCRNGFLDWSPRLMLAMYTCDIQVSTTVVGKVFAVVGKRRGRIIAEDMKEGTSLFNVTALLPVIESFGFADDIRKRTSGAAFPLLLFSGYETLDIDPFWVPRTEEELEDLGEKSDRLNIAKYYVDSVRERKGLFVDRKLIECAEKQRTLKR